MDDRGPGGTRIANGGQARHPISTTSEPILNHDDEPRAAAAFDRVVGNVVNTAVAMWVARTTGDVDSGSFIGSMVGPLSEELSYTIRRVVNVQHAKAQTMVDEAVACSGYDEETLLSKCLADPAKVELLYRALQAAAHASTERKLRLIAELFTAGALASDSTVVDEQFLALDAIGKLETPHFRLLTFLVRPSPLWWDDPAARERFRYSWSEHRIGEENPGLKNVLPALLAATQSLGMIRDDSTDHGIVWSLTSFGRICIEALSASDIPSTDSSDCMERE